jgi:hypothetical protein
VLIRGARPEVRPRKPEGSCFALLEWIAINPRDMFGFNRVPGFLHKTLYIYICTYYIYKYIHGFRAVSGVLKNGVFERCGFSSVWDDKATRTEVATRAQV